MSERDTHTGELVAMVVWDDVGVRELQSRLFDLGYYDGRVDGMPRPQTFAALARFQQDHGLPISGRPDAQTMQIMRESYCY